MILPLISTRSAMLGFGADIIIPSIASIGNLILDG
jgi:hypothetical protein